MSRHVSTDIDEVASCSYFVVMQTVGIKALKDHLSVYVRAAEAGETVLVTDRGKVIAELVPPRAPAMPASAVELLAQLAREGVVTPAKRRSASPPASMPLASFEELMRGLAADREDR
jgi:antitoxin (DNA-binding transcriptional repressor) of toxin-antitoxin stability system